MGKSTSPAKMLGTVPTYYVTDTIEQDAGDGNVRIFNYARINGVLVPQFECVIASPKLLLIGRRIAGVAQEVFNSVQLRIPGIHVH